MRAFVVLTAIVTAFAIAPLASGGGWATVGFEPLPDGTDAGSTWSPTIFVKQHGVTPLTGLQPIVSIHRDDTAELQTFRAVETSEPGVYEADVVFPADGEWRVAIESGFGASNVTYGPVAIGSPGSASGGLPELPVMGLGVLAIAVIGGVALLAARRSRRLTPVS